MVNYTIKPEDEGEKQQRIRYNIASIVLSADQRLTQGNPDVVKLCRDLYDFVKNG